MSNGNNPDVYAVKHKDFETRMNSRSGGIFTALSDIILANQGIVYGCILDDDFNAIHYRATDTKGRNLMRGSKYIQSTKGDIFESVKSDLEDGLEVLFSGTCCEITGLKGYLRKDYDNLLCVDIVCHGVPSNKVWESYLNWREEKYGKCTYVDFRNKKKFGWADHVETMRFSKNNKTKEVSSRIYATMFYGHCMLRPCCYKCPYKSVNHPGDMTIADYWEIDRAYPGYNDNKGVSLVFINNNKGQSYFDQCKSCIEWKQTRLEDSTRPSMLQPFSSPDNRDDFWNDYYTGDFTSLTKKYGGNSFKAITKRYLRSFMRRIKRVVKRILRKN